MPRHARKLTPAEIETISKAGYHYTQKRIVQTAYGLPEDSKEERAVLRTLSRALSGRAVSVLDADAFVRASDHLLDEMTAERAARAALYLARAAELMQPVPAPPSAEASPFGSGPLDPSLVADPLLYVRKQGPGRMPDRMKDATAAPARRAFEQFARSGE